MYKILLYTLLFSCVGFAQSYWQPVSESQLIFLEKTKRNSHPRDYQLFYLDQDIFKQQLQGAPIRGSFTERSTHLIWLPNKGKLERFHVIETPIMEEELAQRYPMIKSYAAQGVDSPGAVARFSVTQLGLHSMIFNTDSSTEFIDPFTVDKQYYIVYKRSNLNSGLNTFECKTEEPDKTSSTELDRNAFDYDIFNTDDNLLRTYRLALSCTAEYGNIFAGTGTLAQQKANIQAQMVITMTRVNGVYEIDLGITMIFVANNDAVIYLGDTAADPWTNEWNTRTAQTLDSVIGVNNYDIGHNFNTTGGGNAGCLACVCQAVSQTGTHKGRGYTGSTNPTGDPFDIDYVAHEMGHQFGGFHTQSNNNCRSGSGLTEVEPGSASTIMGYAGICAANVQNNSDAYFAYVNIRDIMTYVKSPTGSCSVNTPIGNQAPIVSAGLDYTIPRSTPFILTAEGFDPDGDELTYTWEQRDPQNPISNVAPIPTRAVGPMFRSIWGTTSPSRFMPNLQTVLAGNTANTWEVVPSVARTMTFSVVARDNVAGGGQTSTDLMTVTVSGTAGPFVVNSPNTNVSWQAGSNQTVTWDVAGTTANGVDTPFVDIYLSNNGGADFNLLLASQVPNDGSELVTMPSATGNQHRIMVRGHNHIFYDVSNTNFTVSSTTPTFSISYDREPGGQKKRVCQGEEVSYVILYETLGGFSGTSTFSVLGQPAGVTVDFSPATISATGTVVMSLTNTDEAIPGFYEMIVTGTSGSITKQVHFYLEVLNSSQDVVVLTSPLHLATNVNPQQVLLEWNSIATSNQFELQLATDLNFEQLVSTQIVTGTSLQVSALTGLQNYFWRVRPLGALCNDEFSDMFRFTTTTVDCSSFSSTNVPVTIPTTAATVNSTLIVPAAENQVISSITVDIDITHTWINDLIITLISPSGTQIRLLNRPCPSSGQYQNAAATFTMDGVSLACNLVPQNAVSGNVIPFDSFASLVGQNTQGTWTLRVQDVFNQDGGAINGWTLNFCVENDNSEVSCGQLTTTWDGSNWSNGFPVDNMQAVIQAPYNTSINGSFEACACIVESGASVLIASNDFIKLQGILNNQGSFIIQDSGSLIQVLDQPNIGSIIVERIARDVSKYDFIYWSTPVESYTILDIPGNNSRFQWDPLELNTNGGLGNWVAYNGNMESGKGYIVQSPNTSPIAPSTSTLLTTFNGVPNNGILDVTIQRGDMTVATVPSLYSHPSLSIQDDNFNLLGNPYPSAISADAFLQYNAVTNPQIEGSVRLWTHGTVPSTGQSNPFFGSFTYNYNPNDYIIYNLNGPLPGPMGFDGMIASGQGFFVLMNEGPNASSTVRFSNDMRDIAYNNNQFFRMQQPDSQSEAKHRIWLDLVQMDGANVRTLVGYIPGATYAKDVLYDAWVKPGNQLNIYSLIEGETLAIQGRPLPFDIEDIVPLGFIAPQAGNYSITIAYADGLFAPQNGQSIYLEDKLTQTLHLLNSGPYSFYTEAGRDDGRFVLRYTNETLSVPGVGQPHDIQVISQSEGIQIKSAGESIVRVTLYDVLGRALLNLEDILSNQWSHIMTQTRQVLLVQVYLVDGSVYTHKIIH